MTYRLRDDLVCVEWDTLTHFRCDCRLLNSTQAGQTASSHHENHGLCSAAISTTSRLRYYRPREAVHEAIMVRSPQAHVRSNVSTGSPFFPEGMSSLYVQ